MIRSTSVSVVPALLAIAVCSGCQTEHHRWQTVVNEDGSVELTISQPATDVLNEKDQQEAWDIKRFHKELDRNIWPGRITREHIDSASPEPDKELKYAIAQGTFESLDQVPEHYRFGLEGTELVSELKHQLTVNDYGLVKEYVWNEEVTDVVRFEDIPAARREMIELLATVVEEGLKNGLGDDYDVSDLVRWIKTDGEHLVEEFTLLINSREIRALDKDEREQRYAALAARYGITEMSDKGLQSFARKRLAEGVKHSNGLPLEREIIDALVPDPENKQGVSEEQLNRFQQPIVDAWKSHVGGDRERPNKIHILLARQVGVHGVPLYGAPQEFDIWLKLPGEVVETNGVLDEAGFLKWSFEKDDIWPTGYQMTARSVLPVRIRDSQVLRKEQLGLRDEILKFLKLVQTDEELRTSVQNCLKENSLQPLTAIEKQRHDGAGQPSAGTPIGTEEQAKWWRARQLLDLLIQDPPAAAN